MPINSSSIPALRTARKVKKRRRAGGGGIFDWSGVGEAMPEHIGRDRPMDPLYTVPKSIFWDLPKKAVDESRKNPLPGLRREDYTDIPPNTTPDPRSPLGGIGVEVPRQGWQPVDPMVGSSLEAGMNVMGGTSLSAPAKGVSEFVAGAGPRDPNLWHPISKVRLPKPISEMSAVHQPVPGGAPERVINPADLQGGRLVPLIGDRTGASTRLTQVNGYKFDRPVEMQGGHGFMAQNADRGAAWASEAPVATGINKLAARVADDGPVYGVYSAMGERSSDFSHHVSDTLSEMILHSKITKAGRRAFDDEMRAIDPTWPGVKSEKLRDHLVALPGGVRNKFAKLMDTARFQKEGFPSVAEARFAVTDPRLLNVDSLASGQSIARLEPERGTFATPDQHRTYSANVPGQYIGGLPESIPANLMYPKMTRELTQYADVTQAAGKMRPTIPYLMTRTPKGLARTEKVDQQWVDNVSKHLEGRGFKLGAGANDRRAAAIAAADDLWWHGTPSGDLKGGTTGLHLGTRQAAREALHSRIGVPAHGRGWTGEEEYGKTLLAGRDTLKKLGVDETGYNVGLPQHDFYPTERQYRAAYSDGTPVPFESRPVVSPHRLTGDMSNARFNPLGDSRANSTMKGQLKRGTAKKGYFYKNDGEDAGSTSIVVPGSGHVRPLDPSEPGFSLGAGATDKRAAALAAADDIHTPQIDWAQTRALEEALPSDTARALDSWVGGTADTLDRVKSGKHDGFGIFNRDALTPAVQERLAQHFAPVREAIRAEHGDTIRLHRYRGAIPEGAKPYDVLSFTNDKGIAEGLAGAQKPHPLIPEAEIAAKEAELERTGRTQIDKSTWLEKKRETLWNGEKEVPVEYIAIMRPDGMVTDTASVREYIGDINSWRAEKNAANDAARANVKTYDIPVDDILAVTNRFGQQEFIVKNSRAILGSGATDKRAAALAAADDVLDAERRLGAASEQAAGTAAPAAAEAPGVGSGGGGSSGARGLPEAQAAAARWAGTRKTLEGQQGPLKIGEDYFVPGPIGKIHDVAEDYMRTVHPDRPYTPPTKYHPIDPEHSKAIAQAYEEMKHTPNDPATKASYDALIDETAKQYQAIKATGLKIEPIPANMPDPYAANPRLAAWDVAENNHLWFFPTEGGFGSKAKEVIGRTTRDGTYYEVLKNPSKNELLRVARDYPTMGRGAPQMRVMKSGNDIYAWPATYATHDDIGKALRIKAPMEGRDNLQIGRGGKLEGGKKDWEAALKPDSDNPMLRNTGEKIGDHELLANDMFRIVHDYFGHLKEGHGFRAAGEDNAWRTHAAMYSDIARPAMTTETRGQNSWVNYGPHGDKNRTASGADTVYADQKVGLMPEWVMRDRGSPEPIIAYHGSPYSFDRFSTQHLGAGEGNQAYGHGLYFAGHEPVSEWYRYQLAARRDAPLLQKYGLDSQDGANIGIELHAMNGDAYALAANYRAYVEGLRAEGRTDMATKNMIKRAEGKIAYLEDPERARGTMYQVAIEADPKKFLDWDNPLPADEFEQFAAQFDKVNPTTRQWLEDWGYRRQQAGQPMPDGEDIVREMKGIGDDAKGFSRTLLEAGIPGIKYLDQGSRLPVPGARQTQNFVAFDDNMIKILRKYGVVGIPAAGVLGVDGEERRAAGGSVKTAMDVARRLKRKKGGAVHLGPIVGDTGGRADKRPMTVPNGSYVLTADHVSGMGEGNTEAGMKRLAEMFPKSKPSLMRDLPHDDAVPIYAADGEFVISPADIEDRFGDLDEGHRILDHWQTSERQRLIETLSELDPPAQD